MDKVERAAMYFCRILAFSLPAVLSACTFPKSTTQETSEKLSLLSSAKESEIQLDKSLNGVWLRVGIQCGKSKVSMEDPYLSSKSEIIEVQESKLLRHQFHFSKDSVSSNCQETIEYTWRHEKGISTLTRMGVEHRVSGTKKQVCDSLKSRNAPLERHLRVRISQKDGRIVFNPEKAGDKCKSLRVSYEKISSIEQYLSARPKVDPVEVALRDVLKRNPNDESQRFQLGWLYLRRGDFEKVSAQMKTILKRDEKHLAALELKGLVESLGGRDSNYAQKRVADYLKMIDYNSVRPSPALPLSNNKTSVDRSAVALKALSLRKAAKSLSSDMKQDLTVSGIYFNSRMFAQSASLLERHRHPFIDSRRALIAIKQGQMEKAKSILGASLKRHPENQLLHYLQSKIRDASRAPASSKGDVSEEILGEFRAIEEALLL